MLLAGKEFPDEAKEKLLFHDCWKTKRCNCCSLHYIHECDDLCAESFSLNIRFVIVSDYLIILSSALVYLLLLLPYYQYFLHLFWSLFQKNGIVLKYLGTKYFKSENRKKDESFSNSSCLWGAVV